MSNVDSDYHSAPVEYCRECRVELTALDDDWDDLCAECAEEAQGPVREDLAA